MKKISFSGTVYVLIALIFAFIFIYPVYFTVISSFKDTTEIWNTMFALPTVIEWDNYRSALMEIGILMAVMNSFIFAMGATFVIMIVVTMAAYVVSRRIIPGSQFLRLYYLLGLMVPAYGMLIPIMQMFTRFGVRDQYWPMILLYAGLNFPMSFFLINNYINSLSREIDESAAIDGCGLLGTVFRIIFPIAIPGISTAAIISFMMVYNELIFANTLLQRRNMMTITVTLLGLRGERFTSFGPMFASIVLSIIPILIVYILFQNKVEDGIMAGSVKG